MPVLSIDGEFSSSNLNCPIAEYSLLDGQDHFELSQLGQSFTVAMTDDSVEDTYEYTVKALAEGGATSTVTGSKDIKTVCMADLVSSFEKEFAFYLPE
jgi:hypothetical protein